MLRFLVLALILYKSYGGIYLLVERLLDVNCNNRNVVEVLNSILSKAEQADSIDKINNLLEEYCIYLNEDELEEINSNDNLRNTLEYEIENFCELNEVCKICGSNVFAKSIIHEYDYCTSCGSRI